MLRDVASVHPYRFGRALTRRPGDSVRAGIRAGDGQDPDPARFGEQHRAYVAALRAAGVAVTVLEPAEAYPDSVFIEDAALCVGDTAILLRPGAPSRREEAATVRAPLLRAFERVVDLPGSGSVDGGDVLVTATEVIVGLSDRTDLAGFDALASVLGDLGLRCRAARTPPGTLHFKTACGLLDETIVLATPELAASGCFAGYRVLETSPGEEPAANVIRVNDRVFVAAGYPATTELLRRSGYSLTILDMSEAARVDGGLSCLSLRFA